MITVTKSFMFESAHRLSNYVGKCERIHGHNYRGIVRVKGEPDDRGIVIDFSDLKQVIKEYIVRPFDHRLILNQNDPFNRGLAEHLEEDWIVWMPNNPTAENMAQYFAGTIEEALKDQYEVEVELFETDDSSAIAS